MFERNIVHLEAEIKFLTLEEIKLRRKAALIV